MPLSHELISQFAKLANRDNKTNSESTVYGTVVVDGNGNKYVQPDGSDQLIPISDGSTSVDASEDQRVSVLIKDHTAIVNGNVSSPSVGSKYVEQEIQKFGVLVAEQIQANEAYFKKLIADEVTLGKLTAAEASIIQLLAKDAEIEELLAGKITVTDLIAAKIDADVVIADKAIIESLKASNIDVLGLVADKAVINELIAKDADLNSLEAKNAYLKFANIDFANIGEAAFEKIFAQSGMFENTTFVDGTFTGTLVGVTIKGDTIEGGTIVAEKLVVRGEDGLLYKLNTDGVSVEAEQTEYNSLHGSIITAKSVTAEKITVDDLVAFGATIGGFTIANRSLYSGVKESIDNSTRGIYMDKDGQLSLGDANRYFKYYVITRWDYTVDGNNSRIDLTDQVDHSASTKVDGALSAEGHNIYVGTLADGTPVYYEHSIIDKESYAYRVLYDESTSTYTVDIEFGNVIQYIDESQDPGAIIPDIYTTTGFEVYSMQDDTLPYYCRGRSKLTKITKNETPRLEISADSIIFGDDLKTSGEDLKKLTEHVKIGTWLDCDFKRGEDGKTIILDSSEIVESSKIADIFMVAGRPFHETFGGVYRGVYEDGTEVYYTIQDVNSDGSILFYWQLNVDVTPSIELAEGDSDFKQVITNKKTMFMDSAVPNTVIDTDGVSTDNLSVDNEIRHNNANGSYTWAFRSNGNYGLSWQKGGVS